ncbi:MAG TPA: hypothetical protein VG389_20380 [Myxococcota bacterium]|nr:hypothetical protein [Myxococcota bacterium]
MAAADLSALGAHLRSEEGGEPHGLLHVGGGYAVRHEPVARLATERDDPVEVGDDAQRVAWAKPVANAEAGAQRGRARGETLHRLAHAHHVIVTVAPDLALAAGGAPLRQKRGRGFDGILLHRVQVGPERRRRARRKPRFEAGAGLTDEQAVGALPPLERVTVLPAGLFLRHLHGASFRSCGPKTLVLGSISWALPRRSY